MNEVHDEYGVYERLARLETQRESMEARLRIVEKPEPETKSSRGFALPDPILWMMIAATALGQGPQVIELLSKVLLK